MKKLEGMMLVKLVYGYESKSAHQEHKISKPPLPLFHQGCQRTVWPCCIPNWRKNLGNPTKKYQELTPCFTHLWALSGSRPYWGLHSVEDQEDESIPSTSNTLLAALFFLLVDSLSRAINHSSVWPRRLLLCHFIEKHWKTKRRFSFEVNYCFCSL